PRTAGNPRAYLVQRWQYRRTSDYGSEDYRVSDPRRAGRDRVRVTAAEVSDDGKSVLLKISEMQPAQQMQIRYRLRAADGAPMQHTIQHTVHALGASQQ
ncbi:MAG: hypothetical protein AAF961_19390, partial [Planctomycetota bacterium]